MRSLLSSVVALCSVMGVNAAWSGVMSDADLQRLPPYCHARLKTPWGSPEAKVWAEQIGSNYLDFYHYCGGLNLMNHYWSARTPKERTAILQQALAEFEYMVSHERPDFAMRAELYANRGEILKLMGKPGEAIRSLEIALRANPKYVRAYSLLADVYEGSKARAKALAVVTEGLRHNPDSKPLRRRYLELGGKEPYPEPVPAADGQGSAARASEAPAPQPATPETPAASPAVDSASAVKAEPAAIGNRRNPYCRFCPPE